MKRPKDAAEFLEILNMEINQKYGKSLSYPTGVGLIVSALNKYTTKLNKALRKKEDVVKRSLTEEEKTEVMICPELSRH